MVSDFKLPQAVTLFSQEKTTINNLWTVYTAANFAVSGIALSGTQWRTAAALNLGYLLFASGHWILLKQSLEINRELGAEITKAAHSEADLQFRSSITKLVQKANSPWISLSIHIVVDALVSAVIWSRILPTAES